MHSLTSHGQYEMRIDLTDFERNQAFAKYKDFKIGAESSKFKLTANGYYGTAGISFFLFRNQKVSYQFKHLIWLVFKYCTLLENKWYYSYEFIIHEVNNFMNKVAQPHPCEYNKDSSVICLGFFVCYIGEFVKIYTRE